MWGDVLFAGEQRGRPLHFSLAGFALGGFTMANSSKIEPINIELFEKAWARNKRGGAAVTKSSRRRIRKRSTRKKKKGSKRKIKKRKSV
jgi:hypothetical protein